MKRTFKCLFIILVMLVGIISVNAETMAQKKAKVSKMLKNYHFNFKYVNMDDNYAMITKIRGEEWRTPEEWFFNMLVRGELENKIDLNENGGMDVFCHKKGVPYEKYVYDENTMQGQNIEVTPEKDMCELYIILDFDDGNSVIETEVTGEFKEVKGKSNYKKEALKIAKEIQKDFYVTDRDIINHVINYKTSTSTFFEGNNVTVEFSDIKKAVEANPNYDFFVGLEEVRRGDYFVGLEEGVTYISRDGIIYSFALHTYGAGTIFYVPKGTSEADYAKVVEQRIKDYIGNDNHTVKVEKSYATWDDGQTVHKNAVINAETIVLSVLGLTEEEYYKKYDTNRAKEKAKLSDPEEASSCDEWGCIAVPVYKLYLDDQELEIGIIEVDDETLNSNGITSSENLATGIIIRTESSSVPLDAMLDIKELELTNEEKNYLNSNGFKEVKAYDLNLFSKILNKYIEKFNVDSEILIPVDKKNNNLVVVYISDDLTTIEKYDIEYVTLNGKLYMSFKTKHFSNYIIVEDTNKNPDTGDNIVMFIGTLMISALGIGILKTKKED